MSNLRLVLMDEKEAFSGLIPSHTVSTFLLAISKGAQGFSTLEEILPEIDSTLWGYFQSNLDPEPLLDGTGDGLLVINWEHCCIESFQQYLPLRENGFANSHNGKYSIEEPAISYRLGKDWKLLDHYFEEV
ncbi:hypothetical protein HYY75_11400 [bacterium]|nr:hypothetical protein [bacterium]